MNDTARTWGSIIDALGGTGEVAAALDQLPSTVSGWRERGIPGPRWAAIVRLAGDAGKSEISLEVMAELAALPKRKPVDVDEVRA